MHAGAPFLYSWRDHHEVKVTLRGELPITLHSGCSIQTTVLFGVDLRDLNHLEMIVRDFESDG